MSPAPYRALTLAIHPTSRGFGWVAFENPLSIYDFGTYGVRAVPKNRHCLRRFERLIARLKPETLVLEAFEPDGSKRATRITKLGRAMVDFAMVEGIDVAVYRFGEVQATFAHLGTHTRQDIAETIARHFPQLAEHLPAKKKAWESERWRMSLFCAAALALTHYQRDAQSVLDTLSR